MSQSINLYTQLLNHKLFNKSVKFGLKRIKLALKALDLRDNIPNRDSVRERVLELLIIEKIKKSEAIKEDIDHTEDELIDFASMLYNFPRDLVSPCIDE